MENLPVILSVIAIVVSIAAALFTWSQARTAAEAKRAEFDAHWSWKQDVNVDQQRLISHVNVMIVNVGRGDAFNVTVKHGGQTLLGRHQCGPGWEHVIMGTFTSADVIDVAWQSNTGKNRKQKVALKGVAEIGSRISF